MTGRTNLRSRSIASIASTVWIAAVAAGLALLPAAAAKAQLDVVSNDPVLVGFVGFAGAGFDDGAGGTLDSDHWQALGLSDGDTTFGGSHTSGDFARGLSAGGATTGGFYAWDVQGDSSVIAAGWQPGASDATPGSLVLRIRNQTGAPAQSVRVTFERWVNNDEPRASTLQLGYQTSAPLAAGETGSVVSSFTTLDTADALGFQGTASGVVEIPQPLADGDLLYLIFSTDDAGGSGGRDEIGIANLVLSLQAARASVPTLGGWGVILCAAALILSGGVALARGRLPAAER